MDPLSLAASIAGLAALVATVVSTTYEYGSSVIRTSSSQKSFLRELQSLRSTLQQLDGVVAEKDPGSAQYPTVSARLSSAVSECQAAGKDLQDNLQKKLNAGKIKGAISRLAWPLAEGDTMKAIEILARYKSLFHLSMTVDTW